MNQKKSGLQRLYEASMDQILKLKNKLEYLEQNGYLLIIVLALSSLLVYQGLLIAIRIGKGLRLSGSSESFYGNNHKNHKNKEKNK